MKLYINTTIISFLLLFSPLVSQGQDQRYTEADIGVTDVFIQANREKLIGNYDKAIELYLDVYKKNKNGAVCYELARTYDQIGEKDRAVEYSEKAIKHDPNNEWYFLFNADMLEKGAKHEEAAKRYRTLVKKDPGNKFFYIKWAFNELEGGNAEKAIAAFNALEKKQGISEDIIHRKFNIYSTIGKNKEAAKELIALSDSEPGNTRYLNNLAGFYMNIGDKKKAHKVYRRILELDPNDASANIALAGNSQSNGKEVSYLKAIHPILEDPEVNLDMKLKELIPYVEKVNEDPANKVSIEMIAIAERLVQIHPNNAKAYSLYGDVLFNSGDLKNAETQYLKTIGLNKRIYAVWEQLMYTQKELGHFAELQNVSTDAINMYPNQASAYYFNSFAQFKLDDTENAKELVNEAILISGKNSGIKALSYILFAEILTSEKEFLKAENICQKAAGLGASGDPLLLDLQGDIAFHLNKVDEAVAYWQKSLEAGNKSEKLNAKIQQRQIIE